MDSDQSSQSGALSHVFIASDEFSQVSGALRLVGLETLMGDPDDPANYVRFGGNGGFHAGLESTEESGNAPMIQLNIRVADIEAAQKALADAGHDIAEPREEPWGAKHTHFTIGALHFALTQD